MPAVRQAGGLNGGRGLDAGDLHGGVVLDAGDLELGERCEERGVERMVSAAVILAAVVTARWTSEGKRA
ncbi:MAG: hypothetical protein WKF96_24370 [Solirubrobacteraceae bacterium]